MLKAGEYVVYPGHGVGRITEISTREIFGKPVQFYSIQIIGRNLKVMMPVKSLRNIGVKPLTGPVQAKNALKMQEPKRRWINHKKGATSEK